MRQKNWFLLTGILSSFSILLIEVFFVAQTHHPPSVPVWYQNPYLLTVLAATVGSAFLLSLTDTLSEQVALNLAFGVGMMICFIALYKASVVPSECLFSLAYTRAAVRCRFLTVFFSVITVLSSHYAHSPGTSSAETI